ncbi:hypothetical protein BJ944DRAFT_259824 [Cunninghamella echinulata]|nr:hypothetical protein BJ944DRAFT_259824 [Cunninghamella echinulata]
MPQSKINLPLRKRTLGRTEDVSIANKRQTRSLTESTKNKLVQTSAFGDPLLEETKITTKRNADMVKLMDSNKEVKKKKTVKQTVLSQLVKRKSPATKSNTTKVNISNNNDNNNKTSQEEKKKEKTDDSQESTNPTHINNNDDVDDDNDNTKNTTINKNMSISTSVEDIKSTTVITKTVEVNVNIKETNIEKSESLTPPTPSASSESPSALEKEKEKEEKEKSNDNEKTFVNIETNNNHRHTVNDKYISSPSLSPVSDISTNLINNNHSNKDSDSNTMTSKNVLTPPSSLDTTPISTTRFSDKPQDKLPSLTESSFLSKLEKERIADERSTLDKLVKALDISLTFHSARNVAAFFHKIQPMLRNSTRKNITLSHVCKVLFLAPELYDVHTKLLKEFGKEIEAHQISFGPSWAIPLSGKSIEERKNLISDRSEKYFEEHKEPNVTIPEKSLPKLDKIVDQKNWLEKANLPDRVRSILELQEKRKAAKEEIKEKSKVTPTGTAKDRAKALLERIRNKQK